jgi:hypothetical protein
MINQFAKLYETSLGQILVLLDDGDYGPEVSIRFLTGIDGLAICQIKLAFDSEDKAELIFKQMTEESAFNEVERQISHLKNSFGP